MKVRVKFKFIPNSVSLMSNLQDSAKRRPAVAQKPRA